MSAFCFRVAFLCSLLSYSAQFCLYNPLNFAPLFPPISFEVHYKLMVAFSLNHYSRLVDPITLRLLSKHAEKTLWRFPIFIFNIPHHADSLTPKN